MENKNISEENLWTEEEVVRYLRFDLDKLSGMTGAIRALHRRRRKMNVPAFRAGDRYFFTTSAVHELQSFDGLSVEGIDEDLGELQKEMES